MKVPIPKGWSAAYVIGTEFTVYVEDREKFAKQKQYRFDDQEVRPNSIYRYRVSSQLLDGSLSAPSNEVEIARGN